MLTADVWLTIGISGGCCEHGDELPGSINYREFFDYMENYQLHKAYLAKYSVASMFVIN